MPGRPRPPVRAPGHPTPVALDPPGPGQTALRSTACAATRWHTARYSA